MLIYNNMKKMRDGDEEIVYKLLLNSETKCSILVCEMPFKGKMGADRAETVSYLPDISFFEAV